MNDKQKEAFDTIGTAIGVPDLVVQITESARLQKEELEGKVEHKSVEPTDEQVPAESENEDKSLAPQLTPEVVRMLAEALTPVIQGPTEPGEGESEEKSTEVETLDVAEITKQIVGSLQLDNLSTAISSLVNEVKEVKERLDQVEQDDDAKVKAKAEAAPQFAWFAASQVEETVKSESETPIASTMPDAVKAIAGRIEDAI